MIYGTLCVIVVTINMMVLHEFFTRLSAVYYFNYAEFCGTSLIIVSRITTARRNFQPFPKVQSTYNSLFERKKIYVSNINKHHKYL